MRTIFLAYIILITVNLSYGQEDFKIKLGSETLELINVFKIYEKVNDEACFYKIEDGVLHYFKLHYEKGEVVFYRQASCKVKNLDLEKVFIDSYGNGLGKSILISVNDNSESFKIKLKKLNQVDNKSVNTSGGKSNFVSMVFSSQKKAELALEDLKMLK